MKRDIKKVLAIVNKTKNHSHALVEDIKAFFKRKNIELRVLWYHNQPVRKKVNVREADLALSIGGDGTLLYCSQLLAGANIPILAVNTGNFGFITEVTSGEWQDIFNKYCDGEAEVSSRIMLDVEVNRGGKSKAFFRGLNDGVITTMGSSKLIRLNAYLSRTFVGRYRADGIVIATPTGSTAYSLSAGGPILYPEMEAFILCPICPFSLAHRPLVVPAAESLEIVVEENQKARVHLSVDGQPGFELYSNDSVVFTKSDHTAHIIRSDRRNFYEVLRTKLKWSGESNA